MKTATPATETYKTVFSRLMSEGWRLTNYGHGWRYFVRGQQPGEVETFRVNAAGTKIEDLGKTWLG